MTINNENDASANFDSDIFDHSNANGQVEDTEFEEISEKKPVSQGGGWGQLKIRAITGFIMGAIALLLLWMGGWILTAAVILISLQMIREWDRLVDPDSTIWHLFGLTYVTVPVLSLLILNDLHYAESLESGFYASLYPVLLVVATDVGAYFSGRYFGGPKLAPRLSPNKTWAGLGGGMLASVIIALAFLPLTPWPTTPGIAVLLGMAITCLAQAGDLFESWIKRRAHRKDSGHLLPGHGGFLDRLDGYVLTLPFYLVLVWSYAELQYNA